MKNNKKNYKLLDKQAYELAKQYLLRFKVHGVTSNLIKKYLDFPKHMKKLQTIKDIYFRMLESAQNANMKAGVIGGSIDGIKNLSELLCGFDPAKVAARYSFCSKLLLEDIIKKVKPRGKIRKTKRAIWPKYCQTIISSAHFLSQFESASKFFEWVDFFDKDSRARAALPMLLSREIDGMGFALSCDFLKELGYLNFGKPDVHIHDIFKGIGLCSKKEDDYHVFKTIVRVANNNGVTAYNVDKLFWLIGSGYFYKDKQLGMNGRVNAIKKNEFIHLAQKELGTKKITS